MKSNPSRDCSQSGILRGLKSGVARYPVKWQKPTLAGFWILEFEHLTREGFWGDYGITDVSTSSMILAVVTIIRGCCTAYS